MNLIVGATGYLGGEICRRLVAAGQPVRALVRPTARDFAVRLTSVRDYSVRALTGAGG